MTGTTTDTTSIVGGLSDAGFMTFCDGVCGMFNVDVRCRRQYMGMESAAVLQSRFKKLTAIHMVASQGTLNGTFYIVFDQGGLFILSGVVVMLPEGRIIEEVRLGSIQDAQNLQDTLGEVGNLLVGSWDTVFRAQCPGHKHFVKKASMVGQPSETLHETGISADGQVLCITYEMTVGSYPSFQCAAVFPAAVIASFGKPATEQVAERVDKSSVPEEPASESPMSEPPAGDVPVSDLPPTELRSTDVPPLSPVEEPAIDDDNEAPGLTEFFSGARRIPCDRRRSEGLAEFLDTQAADIMQTDLVWARPEETVQAVLAKMQQHNTGYVLIGQNGVIEGLVSSSTILGAVSLYLRPMFSKWRRPEDDATLGVRVKWIMSRPVRTIRPDTSLDAIIEYMRRCGGRCLPVVDEDGAVKGMVTVFDILLHILALNGEVTWKGRPPQAPALLL